MKCTPNAGEKERKKKEITIYNKEPKTPIS